jgi:hypothetical protein
MTPRRASLAATTTAIALAAWAASTAGGCSWTFGGDEPLFPLVGAPLSVDELPVAIRHGDEVTVEVVAGADGAPWLALSREGGALAERRFVRLAAPQQTIAPRGRTAMQASRVVVVDAAADGDRDRAQITWALLGTPSETTFEIGAKGGVAGIAFDAVAPAFIVRPADGTGALTALHVPSRTVAALDPPPADEREGLLFGGDGTVVFRTRERRVVEQRILPPSAPVEYEADGPARLQVVAQAPGVARCSDGEGLSFWAAGALVRVLDRAPCAAILWSSTHVYYARPDGTFEVPLDGSGPPARVDAPPSDPIDAVVDPGDAPPGWRVLLRLGPRGERKLLTNTPGTAAAFDAYLDGVRIIERGRSLSQHAGGLLFIEKSANDAHAGDLVFHPLDGRPRQLLERNVTSYAIDPLTARILAVANRVVAGAHNRLVAIDLSARTRRLVATGIVDLHADVQARSFLPEGLFLRPFRPAAPRESDLEIRFLPFSRVPR